VSSLILQVACFLCFFLVKSSQKKMIPVLGSPIPVWGMKVKQVKGRASLFLKINQTRTILTESSR